MKIRAPQRPAGRPSTVALATGRNPVCQSGKRARCACVSGAGRRCLPEADSSVRTALPGPSQSAASTPAGRGPSVRQSTGADRRNACPFSEADWPGWRAEKTPVLPRPSRRRAVAQPGIRPRDPGAGQEKCLSFPGGRPARLAGPAEKMPVLPRPSRRRAVTNPGSGRVTLGWPGRIPVLLAATLDAAGRSGDRALPIPLPGLFSSNAPPLLARSPVSHLWRNPLPAASNDSDGYTVARSPGNLRPLTVVRDARFTKSIMPQPRAAQIRLLVLDVDGVLTDGGIHIDDRGAETKIFHVRDGTGISAWLRLGNEAAIITGRTSLVVAHRARELGIRHVFQGLPQKLDIFDALLRDLAMEAAETAVIGDDLQDLPLLERAGYPIAVADAVSEVRAVAHYVTRTPGGRGAVREAIEHLLREAGQWDQVIARFRGVRTDE